MKLSLVDGLVILAYFALNLGIGLYYRRRATRSMSDFFLSGRNVTWWLAGTSMVATTFAGVLERFALLLLPQDVLAEKFFEPSVSSRGLPTFVTTDPEEATYWISAKVRPVR